MLYAESRYFFPFMRMKRLLMENHADGYIVAGAK